MNELWAERPLSELMSLDVEHVPVDPGAIYPILGVLNRGRGLLRREPLLGSATSYTKLNRIRPRQVVYSRLKAFEGAITVVPDDVAGYASPEFPTFTCGDDLIPGYMRLITTMPWFWVVLEGLSKGMGGRRERVSAHDLLAARVPIPTLTVQRRIVDLMAHLDNNLAKLQAEAEAGHLVEALLIEGLLAGVDGVEHRALGEVGTFIRGRRFTKAEYVESGLGCIHYGQVHTHFGPVARQVLTFLPLEARSRLRLARPGDVVIVATSEDFDGLGKATVWLGDDDVAVHDDCYIYRHGLDPKFASYAIASRSFQREKRQYGDGTKVTRIAAADLAKIPILIPPLDEQVRVGETMAQLTSHINALRAEVDALASLRTVTLALLLSGRVAIPSDYDALLEGVA